MELRNISDDDFFSVLVYINELVIHNLSNLDKLLCLFLQAILNYFYSFFPLFSLISLVNTSLPLASSLHHYSCFWILIQYSSPLSFLSLYFFHISLFISIFFSILSLSVSCFTLLYSCLPLVNFLRVKCFATLFSCF